MLEKLKRLSMANRFVLTFTVIIVISHTAIIVASNTSLFGNLSDLTIDYSQELAKQLTSNTGMIMKEIEDRQHQYVITSGIGDDIKNLHGQVNPRHARGNIVNKLTAHLVSEAYISELVYIDLDGNIIIPNIFDEKQRDYGELLAYVGGGEGGAVNAKPRWHSTRGGQLIMQRNLYHPSDMRLYGYLFLFVDQEYFLDGYRNHKIYDRVSFYDGVRKLGGDGDGLSDEIAALRELPPSGSTVGDTGTIIIYDRPSRGDIRIILLIDRDKMLREVFRLSVIISLVCIGSLLFAVLMSKLLTTALLKDFMALVERIQTFSRGIFRGDRPGAADAAPHQELTTLSDDFSRMAMKIEELISDLYQAEFEARSSEYKALLFEYNALQTVMDPHFLYNTLETINGYAKLRGEEEIAECMYLLGGLIRRSMSFETTAVPLRDEISFINDYSAIHKYAYGSDFSIALDIAEDALDCMIPKLVVQPIVENAIKYGVESKQGRQHVGVRGRVEDGLLRIVVSDNGIGMSRETIRRIETDLTSDCDNKVHIGIKSAHKRIRILYGDGYGVSILHSVEGEGTEVEIRLPAAPDRGTDGRLLPDGSPSARRRPAAPLSPSKADA